MNICLQIYMCFVSQLAMTHSRPIWPFSWYPSNGRADWPYARSQGMSHERELRSQGHLGGSPSADSPGPIRVLWMPAIDWETILFSTISPEFIYDVPFQGFKGIIPFLALQIIYKQQ